MLDVRRGIQMFQRTSVPSPRHRGKHEWLRVLSIAARSPRSSQGEGGEKAAQRLRRPVPRKDPPGAGHRTQRRWREFRCSAVIPMVILVQVIMLSTAHRDHGTGRNSPRRSSRISASIAGKLVRETFAHFAIPPGPARSLPCTDDGPEDRPSAGRGYNRVPCGSLQVVSRKRIGVIRAGGSHETPPVGFQLRQRCAADRCRR